MKTPEKITEAKVKLQYQEEVRKEDEWEQEEIQQLGMTSKEMEEIPEKIKVIRRTAEEVTEATKREETVLESILRRMIENEEKREKERILDKEEMKLWVAQNKEDLSQTVKESTKKITERINEMEKRLKIQESKTEKLIEEQQNIGEAIRVAVLEDVFEKMDKKEKENSRRVDGKMEKMQEHNECMTKIYIRGVQEKLEKRVEEIKIGQQSITATSPIDISGISIGNLGYMKGEITPAFYNDERVHPMQYLRNIKEIIDINFNGNTKMYHRRIMFLIKNSLKGEAELWYSINEEKCNSFEAFESLFIRQYWAEHHQGKSRNKLLLGKYNALKDGESRERYALKLYNEVRYLEPKMSERDIVSRIANHYEEDIALQVVVRDMQDLNTLIHYLRRIDEKHQQLRRPHRININHIRVNQPQEGTGNRTPYRRRSRSAENRNERSQGSYNRNIRYDNREQHRGRYRDNYANYRRTQGACNYSPTNQYHNNRNYQPPRVGSNQQRYDNQARRNEERAYPQRNVNPNMTNTGQERREGDRYRSNSEPRHVNNHRQDFH